MNKKITYLLLIFCLLSPAIVKADEEKNEWYPFILAEKMDPNSPLNIGKLVLDAPAGKHGFVTVKDGHFYFENGTRARFWGTNLAFGANFPSKKEAKLMADRLAFFGFNAVRLHHMDSYFEPKGIFKDTAPAYKDPQLKETGHLSKNQLDRLDYLIYQLKQRGIYVDINLLVSRYFTEADGVKDAKELGMAAKPVSMFDPRLIALQKKYAKDLLTHYNPYTKLKYNEDPAIALIEITNENSIVASWKNNILDNLSLYYVNQLDQYWNNWLKDKYGTIIAVKAAWSITEQQPITKNQRINQFTIELHDKAKAILQENDGITTINISNITKVPWHLQYRTVNVDLKKDTPYLLTFTASADKETRIRAISQQTFNPWKDLGLSQEIILSKNNKTYEIPFAAIQDYPNAKVGFIIGYKKSSIVINNITLKKIEPQAIPETAITTGSFKFSRPSFNNLALHTKQVQDDIRNFYIDLTNQYLNAMKNFLNNEIAIRIPITGIGGYSQIEDIAAQQNMDFIDTHTYWDHPKFPNKPWDKNDFTIHNKSMLEDKDLGIVGTITKRHEAVKVQYNKPFTISEWNHCYPNKYAYETPPLMATYALKNDWDALFQFTYSGGWKIKPKINEIQNHFDIIANPQQLSLMSLGSLIYLNHNKNDVKISLSDEAYELKTPFISGIVGGLTKTDTFKKATNIHFINNGAYFRYTTDNKSLLESLNIHEQFIGEIKNTKSDWNKKNNFRWGKPPTLMKNIIEHP